MKKVVSVLIFVLIITSFRAQIVFNTSSTKSGNGVSSLTYTKTVAAGNNRLLYVGVTTQNKNITSVTWNAQALTQFTIGTKNSMRVAMYYIVLGSSASPTTANVVVTLAGGTDCFSGAADYSGVWQAPPLMSPTAAQAKSLYPSITFTSVVGHKAISLLGDIAASPTANGPGQTQYWTFTGSHSNRSTEEPGAASVTMSHTLSANEDWVMLGGTMLDYAVVLPVELLSFEATLREKQVDVSWTTANELNNDYFTVEHSKDAVNFEDLGQVDGAGNSNVQLNYSFTDNKPYTGVTYYRLRQTDFNSSIKYSKIVAVNISDVEILNFFPNPTTDNSNVIISSPEDMLVNFKIISSDGKLLSDRSETIKKGVNEIKLDIASYAEGNYIFSVNSANKVLAKKQFIVK